jgi:2-polyprenyl-6-methoxyphenol hydroxylase-like FAD-dependent oxidoreductase
MQHCSYNKNKEPLMKAPSYKVLIIGGGFSGMAAAIQSRKSNIAVDLVELDKDWRSYGAGITISGPSLRALGELGVLDSIVEQGWCADGCDVHTADGTFISQLPTPRIAGEHVPGAGEDPRQGHLGLGYPGAPGLYLHRYPASRQQSSGPVQ